MNCLELLTVELIYEAVGILVGTESFGIMSTKFVTQQKHTLFILEKQYWHSKIWQENISAWLSLFLKKVMLITLWQFSFSPLNMNILCSTKGINK